MKQYMTLWDILTEFKKVEIPIIQRDYAQGRADEGKIRNNLLTHILNGLTTRTKVELDFVYGTANDNIFIPIDGQQRLTTLWLLHWYLAASSNQLDEEVKSTLKKFHYETRPSSHMFLENLCERPINFETPIRSYLLKEAGWFDEEWRNDPSVMGFITMLETIAAHPLLKNADKSALFDILISTDIVSFNFLPLDDYGLNEEIYTRMNARGKLLTPFEKFKSNFFKIIGQSQYLHEITEKIEYAWVKKLWPYRKYQGDPPKEVFTIDKYFLNYLSFITRMLYYRQATSRERADTDFTDEEVIASVYKDEENIRFLVFAFDKISELADFDPGIDLIWDDCQSSFGSMIREYIIKGNAANDTLKALLLFSGICFLDKTKSRDGISDFLRVIRNLIENTQDKSQREWPRILTTINRLISNNIYKTLCNDEIRIDGFYSNQVTEERVKAKIITSYPERKAFIHGIEDHKLLHGNIRNLLICVASQHNASVKNCSDIPLNNFDFEKLKETFEAYQHIATDDFNCIWGDLLCTSMYTANEWRCVYNENYQHHPSVMQLAYDIAENRHDLEKTLIHRECRFIKDMYKKHGQLESVSEPKEQLYLLYIISARLKEKRFDQFFKNNGFNFGWLDKTSGFSTPFVGPLAGCNLPNQIYQTYPTYFQYNRGLLDYRTPDVLLANGCGKRVFDRLLDWCNEVQKQFS